jgi:hypothetical protein
MAMKIALEILSPLPLTNHEDGKMIFDLWQKYLPNLLPDKFGNWEPINRPFELQHIETVLQAWKWPFFAVKKSPAVDASILMRKGAKQHLHATWILRLDANAVNQVQLIEFLKMASVALQADFSCLHLLTPPELERGRASKVVSALDKKATKLRFMVASRDLQERIPDLFWATVLGAPYVELFGRDCLLSAPAYRAESLSSGMVLVQMTEQISDVEKRADVFNETRSQVKTHLGAKAFFQPERVTADGYRVPQFNFV